MKKILLFLFTLVYLSADAQIAFQGFEGTVNDNWNFTAAPNTYNTSGDVWAAVGSVGTINSGAMSTATFWGMQDLDNPNGGGSFQHTLTFNQDVSGFVNVTVSFFYNAFEFDAGDDLDYELFYDGVSQGNVNLIDGVNGGGTSSGGWVPVVVNVPDAVNAIILVLKAQQNGGGDYGGWDNVEVDGTAAMPVELTTFTAKPATKRSVMLEWATASEDNNDYFAVEHSRNGIDFEEVDYVQGAGTTLEPQSYTYLHEQPAKGSNYYRLKQMDYDGAFSYSPIEVVNLQADKRLVITPTLASQQIQVSVSEEVSEQGGMLQIFDLSGRQVISTPLSGDIRQQINVSELQNGHYFLRISSDRVSETARFVKIN